MSTLGTFDSFTTARLGIYAAQHGLHITGNNISNINTDRYTRQRVDQVSFKTGSTDRYASWADNHMGSGVLVSGISQIRDPFLDIRYRTTATDTYYYDAKLSGLQSIATILDEVGDGTNEDGLLYAQFQDVLKQLRAFSANPTKDNDTLVRNSAEALASLFRTYAGDLDELYENAVTDFNNSITKVNEILTNIRDLDEAIRDAEIHGDKALEMRDERNRQIDELSKYMSIRVEYSYEDVGAGVQVEKLTIKMGNSNPDKSVHTDESILVDGVYATHLSVPEKRPRLNEYDGTNPPESDYLKGYKYLREVTMTAEELADFEAEYGHAPIWERQDENGNNLYLMGTNDSSVLGIVADEDNDNFTVQLDKLMDRKGNIWKSTETTWASVIGDGGPAYAQIAYTISNSLQEGDQFGIGQADGTTKTFTVVANNKSPLEEGDIRLADVENAAAFAKFVAKELSESGRYGEYNITSSGDQVIFTAKNPGSIANKDEGAPADWPDLTVNDPGFTGLLTASPGYPKDGAPIPDDAGTVTDEYGNTTTIKYVESGGTWYRVKVETKNAREIALDDNDLHGILQAQREMLTEEGEFASAKDVIIDENACIKRGIPYYIKSLDLLAQKFAEAYNELNQGYKIDQNGNYLTEDNMYIKLGDEPVNKAGLTDAQKAWLDELKDSTDPDDQTLYEELKEYIDDDGNFDVEAYAAKNGAYSMGGPLFSNSNAGDNTTDPRINAHNIDISAGWSNGAWGIVPKFEVLLFAEGEEDLEHSTQNVNADHMVSLLLDKALTYDPRDLHGSDAIGPVLFEGTFNDMLSNMMGVEASDERITNVNLLTSDIRLTELDYSREGVSGVDLNDEAMNMITYQKAMNAAMRLMTAIDEALDRLINNTGVAGR